MVDGLNSRLRMVLELATRCDMLQEVEAVYDVKGRTKGGVLEWYC